MPGTPLPPAPLAGVPRPVTREMIQERTRSMAVTAGRSPLQISQADYEKARRELTGESDMDRQEARLDAGALSPPAASAARENPAP